MSSKGMAFGKQAKVTKPRPYGAWILKPALSQRRPGSGEFCRNRSLSTTYPSTMQDNIEQKIKQLMADILRLDPRSVGNETAMDNTPSWDSTNHIILVLALEEEFLVSFDVPEIEAMTSFRDIIQSIN